MIIEISGRNQDFFRRISRKNYVALVRTVPAKWTVEDLDRLHKGLWELSRPTRIASTGEVEATFVDNQDDIATSQESWEENQEALVDECDHRNTFDRRGHLCCKDCGGVDV